MLAICIGWTTAGKLSPAEVKELRNSSLITMLSHITFNNIRVKKKSAIRSAWALPATVQLLQLSLSELLEYPPHVIERGIFFHHGSYGMHVI